MKQFMCVLFFMPVLVFAEPAPLSAQADALVKVSVEIRNVTTGDGIVHVGVFGETAFRTDTPDMEFYFEPAAAILSVEVSLPAGEYVMVAYQDTNGNDELDSGLFGIPKEPFGITNWNGGLPGSFDKRKVAIHDNSIAPVIIGLRKRI